MNKLKTITLQRDDEFILVIVHNPPVNTITAEVRADLRRALDDVRQLQDAKALLLACEGSTFFSGADIGEFSGPPREVEYREIYNAFENLPIPVIAAMHGTVLGGGLEIALACHYRIAAPGTRFGLPEVTLGIIPGAGGTQRMPRLIGVEKTAELILSARPIDAAQAKALGFVDTIVEGDLLSGAKNYARSLLAAGHGVRRTGDRTVDPASISADILTRLTEHARQLYPNHSAGLVAIEAVTASAKMPLAEGLELETRLVNECKKTDASKGSVHAFFAERETRRVPDLPADALPRLVRAIGIVGAGTMGGGIAICCANAGIPVTIVDASREALDRGLGIVDRTLESMVKRGRLSSAEKAKRLSLIKGSLAYEDLRDADLIIEAVFENMELKKSIFSSLDRIAKPGAILATNTSTLDVGEIALATTRPQDVIGLHFFSPANVMPLLEVIRAPDTSPQTIRTVMELSKPLRKTPVLARVCYGFIGNRMMEGYAREAERMVLEGATPRQVDSALEEWGMAMGILAVFDMAGIDVGVNIHKANADRYPPDPTYYQADFALVEAGRLGQKNSKGYYRYEAGDRKRHDDPDALTILRARAAKLGMEPRQHSKEEILERCLYPLMNEGIRLLDEGIALRASDIDVVWNAGYGFPRYRGGPLFYADTIGLATLLDGILKYQRIFGPTHWQPAPLLEKLVRDGLSIKQWEATRANKT